MSGIPGQFKGVNSGRLRSLAARGRSSGGFEASTQ